MFVQTNAAEHIQRLLRAVVNDEVKIRSELPDGWSVDQGPTVTVVSDGTPSRGVATATENVRINAYSRFAPEARALASLCDSWLLDPSHVEGFSISPSAGLLCARDESTGGWVCSITVSARGTKKGM